MRIDDLGMRAKLGTPVGAWVRGSLVAGAGTIVGDAGPATGPWA